MAYHTHQTCREQQTVQADKQIGMIKSACIVYNIILLYFTGLLKRIGNIVWRVHQNAFRSWENFGLN